MSERWRVGMIGLLFLAAGARGADDRNPFAGDAKAAKAGEYEFRINCALCHGLGAKGGGRETFTQRGDHAAGDEDVPGHGRPK